MATKKEVAAQPSNALPAHLQGGKTTKIGNVDRTDLIIPRVKLLQGISPEIEAYENAKAGQFWHTIAGEPLGDKLDFIPIVVRKSIVLWAPRNDERGILARSADCVNWDSGFANLEFEIKPKGAPKPIKVNTGENVASSFVVDHPNGDSPSLDDFGSSIPGDPRSAPLASLTYNFMFYFPDFEEYSPAVVINTRSSIRPAKSLLSKIDMRPVDHFYQRYTMGVTDEKSDDGPYKGYSYTANGYADEATAEITKALFDRWSEEEWQPSEESEEAASSGGSASDTKAF